MISNEDRAKQGTAAKRTLPLATLQQALAYLFDDSPHALSNPFEHWLTTSKPFALFAQSYRQKIRKKVRTAQDAEETHNLYCELRTAYLLLQEPKFAVEYEPYVKERGRSPDFAVTYRTHPAFHVEVTRLRPLQQGQRDGQESGDEDGDAEGSAARALRYESRRLADVVCDKLGQLAPAAPNILWVWVQSRTIHDIEIEQLIPALKRRVEQRDAELLARHGFRNPADFMRSYQRLSAVLVQNLHAPEAGESLTVWSNNDARYPLSPKMVEILRSLIAADTSLEFTAGRLEEG